MERVTMIEQARRYIEVNPGCSTRELADALGLQRENIGKLLRRDVLRGNIDSDVIKGVAHYWLQARINTREARGNTEYRIVELLRQSRPMSSVEIAQAINRTRSQVWATLERMERAGTIKATVYGRPLRWYAAARGSMPTVALPDAPAR
jgi:predicted transcriptional regulator